MAHQSGYGGSVVFGTGDAPAAIAVGLEAWSVNQNTEIIEARAKGDGWKTKFAGASEWDGQITCLIADDAADGLLVASAAGDLRTFTDLLLKVNAADYLTGSGFISTVAIENPVDGPAKATYGLTGNGALAQTHA